MVVDQLLKYIINGMNIAEIKKKLNLTDKELMLYLKELKGMAIPTYPKLYSDGNLFYKINKTDNDNLIELNPNKWQELDIIAISDLHFGSGYERIDLLDKVYEYAIKNNIHIILNLGDLIHGRESKISTESQIEKVINEYPQDENIKNIILLGNHDFHSLYYDEYDIVPYLFSERPDFINAGYGVGSIDVMKQQILLRHNLSIIKNSIKKIDNCVLQLNGHSHYFKMTTGSILKINVPTLSDIIFPNKITFPSFLKLKLVFCNGKIEKISVENKVFSDSIITVSDLNYSVPVKKKK